MRALVRDLMWHGLRGIPLTGHTRAHRLGAEGMGFMLRLPALLVSDWHMTGAGGHNWYTHAAVFTLRHSKRLMCTGCVMCSERLCSTCWARHDGAEAVLPLDVVQHIEHAHAHAVLGRRVLVALQLRSPGDSQASS